MDELIYNSFHGTLKLALTAYYYTIAAALKKSCCHMKLSVQLSVGMRKFTSSKTT